MDGHTLSPRNGEGAAGQTAPTPRGQTTSPASSLAPGAALLRARDVAEILNVSASTVLDWFESGRLPGFKLNGRAVRFDRDEVAGWLAAQRREAAA